MCVAFVSSWKKCSGMKISIYKISRRYPMVSNQYNSLLAVNTIGSEVLRPVEYHVVLTGTENYVKLKWKTKSYGGYADYFRHEFFFSMFDEKLHIDYINKEPEAVILKQEMFFNQNPSTAWTPGHLMLCNHLAKRKMIIQQ